MSELPDNNHDEARRWLANVQDDLAGLRAVQRDADSPRRLVCFMAHLVVEKSLKTALIDAGVPFRKVYDLEPLYEMCKSAGRLAGIDEEILKSLTPWAIDGRYADELLEAGREQAERFARFAEQVVTAVRAELEPSAGND
jgi:HEPN domain-containing protein